MTLVHFTDVNIHVVCDDFCALNSTRRVYDGGEIRSGRIRLEYVYHFIIGYFMSWAYIYPFLHNYCNRACL